LEQEFKVIFMAVAVSMPVAASLPNE